MRLRIEYVQVASLETLTRLAVGFGPRESPYLSAVQDGALDSPHGQHSRPLVPPLFAIAKTQR